MTHLTVKVTNQCIYIPSQETFELCCFSPFYNENEWHIPLNSEYTLWMIQQILGVYFCPMLLICLVLLTVTWICRVYSFVLWSGLSYFRILTICLLLVYFVSAAGCHCFDLPYIHVEYYLCHTLDCQSIQSDKVWLQFATPTTFKYFCLLQGDSENYIFYID